MSREVMQQALELLMVATFNSPELQAKRSEVIAAGLAVLAQPEQEPVAYMYHDPTRPEALRMADLLEAADGVMSVGDDLQIAAELRRLHQSEREGWRYANELEQERQPLTDEEIVAALMPVNVFGDGYYLRIARAIEAAHGIGAKP